jgi:hypothetical protein
MVDDYGGFGSPRHAFISIYSDGSIIFSKQTESAEVDYQTAKVFSASELLKKLGAEVLPDHSKRYELSYSTDQPGTRIWYRGKCIGIYGNWRAPRLYGDEHDAEAKELWESLPGEIRDFCRRIDSFSPEKAVRWHPDLIRVTLEPTDHPVGKNPVTWPEDLPGPKTAKITQRDYGMFSFDIPYQFLDRVNAVRDEMVKGRSLVIDGKRHNIWVSVRLPGQDIWERDQKAAFGNRMP